MWKKICYHLLFWTVFKGIGFIYWIYDPNSEGVKKYFWDTILYIVPLVAIIYVVALYIIPTFLPKKQGIFKVILAIIGLYIVFAYGVRYQLVYTFQPWLNPEQPYPPFDNAIFYKDYSWACIKVFLYEHGIYNLGSSWIFLESLMYGTGYWFVIRSGQHEREKRKIAEQHRLLEKQHYEAELAFLKNQLNPHFLYNTLNYIYSEVFQHSQELGDNVIKISDLLRYSLKGNASSKVFLSEEIHFLENFISINKLRFDNELCIEFEVLGNVEKKQILPLILISFVENAFKHGDLRDAKEPLVIKIEVNEEKMHFYIRNKIGYSFKENSTGIGLVNLRRRLELAYGSAHKLIINQDSTIYECDLTIFE